MNPATKQQFTTILQLQAQLGASAVFVEPRLVYGTHPPGWKLTAQNAVEIIDHLRLQIQHANHVSS